MNNERFTFLKSVRAMALTLFALCAMGVSQANASCVCSAESTVTIKKDTDPNSMTFNQCIKALTPADLGISEGCEATGLTIEAKLITASEHWKGSTNIVLPAAASIVVSVPGRYEYTIRDATGAILCWEHFIAEDKSGPVCANDGSMDVDDCYNDDADFGKAACDENPKGFTGDDQLHLKSFLVSCTYDEDPKQHYATLEENDFMDCTGINEVFFKDLKYTFCAVEPGDLTQEDLDALVDLTGFTAAEILMFMPQDVPAGWEICEINIRQWFASDWNGNVSVQDINCTQAYAVIRPGKDEIEFDWTVKVECDGNDIATRLGDATGSPYFQDVDETMCGTDKPYLIKPNDHSCKYAATYHEDGPIYTCDDRYASCADNKSTGKIVRHWTLIDWCATDEDIADGENKITGTQIIEVIDTTGPSLEFETTYWPSAFDCTVTLRIEAESKDECSSAEHEIFVEYSTEAHGGGSFKRVGPYTAASFNVPNVPIDADVKIFGAAWDCCGNVTRDTMMGVKVLDQFDPICISNDALEVSLIQTDHGGDAVHTLGARIKAEDLDDTSYDACSAVTLEVRDPKAAAGTPNASYGPYVQYEWTTADFQALTGGTCIYEVWVELKVTDAAGNSSTCNTLLQLRDETPPTIPAICNDARTSTRQSTYQFGKISDVSVVGCDDKVPGFDDQDAWGSCVTTTSVMDSEKLHCPTTIYVCNVPYANIVEVLYKTTTVTKEAEHATFTDKVTEVILIEGEFEEKFTFPLDYKVSCDAAGGLDIPAPATLDEILNASGCSPWKMNVTQDTFRGADDACYTIIRDYEFINECRFDENFFENGLQIDKDCADTNGDGKLIGEAPVMLSWSSDPAVDLFFSNVTGIRASVCQAWEFVPKSATNPTAFYRWAYNANGTPVLTTGNQNNRILLATGQFHYTQVIKVYDNIDPTATIDVEAGCDELAAGCLQGTAKFTVTANDVCSSASMGEWYINEPGNKEGFTKSGNMFIGTGLAKGEYELHVRIEDQCGNFIWATETAEVLWDDCKAPTIVCVPGFTSVMENATVDVWASELVVSLSDNCATEAELEGRLHIVAINEDTNGDGQIDGGDAPAAPADLADWKDVVTLSCEEFGYVNRAVAIYTRDNEDNDQFCTTFVSLQPGTSSPDACAPGAGEPGDVASLLGEITNENDEMVGDVTVTVAGSGFSTFADIFNGNFSFSVPMSSDASITPSKDRGHLNGVGTADLVALQRHILGITPLTSAYKIIAADVTNDQSIDARDMLHISRLVLGIYTELPNVDSWTFVDKDFVFANPTSPWGYPTAVDYATLGAEVQANFIGVKMGDLTGNASAINLLGDDSATNGEMTIAIADAKIAAGSTHTIEFTAKDFNDFAGYQFSIQLAEGVSFEGFEVGSLPNHSEANFGLSNIADGIITTNWANASSIDLQDGDVLFTLTVGASSDIDVSSAIEVNSVVTPAEAYNNGLEVFDVRAQFSKTDSAFELFQNTPNPFSNETLIGFNLPEAGAVSLKVMDVSGRTLKAINGTYTAGFHQVSIAKSELGATGVLYYQLDTNSGSATKKMIILE